MSNAPLVIIPDAAAGPRDWQQVTDLVGRHADCAVVDLDRCESIAAMADKALREAPARFALCGHGMGGNVALEMARRAPERIEKLVLANTCPEPASAEEYDGKWAEIAANHDMGGARLNHTMAMMDRPDLRHVLPELRMPVLVIAGPKDAETPLNRQLETGARIPHAKLEIMIGCGHAPHLEKPARLARIIRDFAAPSPAIASPQTAQPQKALTY